MEEKKAPARGQNKYEKLAGNTMIFAISSFSSKLLTLIVQPFLTYAMRDVASMGISKLLSQCANLLIPFVSMGMSNAIIRFGLDKGNSKKQVFTNGLLTILLGYGVLLLCWPLLQQVPGVAGYGVLLCIYVLTSCLRTLCTQFIRSREMNRLVGVDGVLCTFATLMFYVLYLVVLDMGAEGYLLAIICGDAASSLFLFVTGTLWRYIDFSRINRTLWREIAPLFPAHDPGADQLLDHQRLGYVLCQRALRGLWGPFGHRVERPFVHRLFPAHHPHHPWAPSFTTPGSCPPSPRSTAAAGFTPTCSRATPASCSAVPAASCGSAAAVMLIMKSSYFDAWQFVPYLTLAAVFSCFTQFMNSIYVVYKPVHPQPVHHDGGGGGQLRHELSGHRVVWPGGGHLCVLPGHGAGVRAACDRQPLDDPPAAAPAPHGG